VKPVAFFELFTTPADAGSPAGNYAVTPGGLTATNYAITFVPGMLTVISPAATTTPVANSPNPTSFFGQSAAFTAPGTRA
jgi:hypothetical protein